MTGMFQKNHDRLSGGHHHFTKTYGNGGPTMLNSLFITRMTIAVIGLREFILRCTAQSRMTGSITATAKQNWKEKPQMKVAVATAVLLLPTMVVSASEITSIGSQSQTVTQHGRLDVSAGFFGGVDMTWDYVSPNLGFASNWLDDPVNVPGVSIPSGSTIDNAMLSWSRTGPSISDTRNLISFSGELGGDITPHPWTQTIINWVEGPEIQWLLPLPPPSGPSGSINLLALFGSGVIPYILDDGGFVLGANTQISLSNGSVSRSRVWWDSDNVFDISASSTVNMQATLDVVFTPPAGPFPTNTPDPSDIPEPSSIMLFGSGFLGLAGLLRRKEKAQVIPPSK